MKRIYKKAALVVLTTLAVVIASASIKSLNDQDLIVAQDELYTLTINKDVNNLEFTSNDYVNGNYDIYTNKAHNPINLTYSNVKKCLDGYLTLSKNGYIYNDRLESHPFKNKISGLKSIKLETSGAYKISYGYNNANETEDYILNTNDVFTFMNTRPSYFAIKGYLEDIDIKSITLIYSCNETTTPIDPFDFKYEIKGAKNNTLIEGGTYSVNITEVKPLEGGFKFDFLSSDDSILTFTNKTNISAELTAKSVGSAIVRIIETNTGVFHDASIEVVDNGPNLIKKNTNITLWHAGNKGENERLQSIINTFSAIEPKVHVTLMQGAPNQIDDLVKNANQPDVAIEYPSQIAEQMKYNHNLNLTSYIEDATYGITDDYDFLEPIYTESNLNQTLQYYSLPYAKSAEALFYNKALIGLTIGPSVNNGNPISEQYMNNLTWNELYNNFLPGFEAYNNKLPEGDKLYKGENPDASLLSYDYDDNLFYTLMSQNHYPIYDMETEKITFKFNNANTINLLKDLHHLKNKGYLLTRGGSSNPMPAFSKINTLNTIMFVTNVNAISIISRQGYEYNIAPIPKIDEYGEHIFLMGHVLGAYKHNLPNSNELDETRALASYLLIKYLTNAENSKNITIANAKLGSRYSTFESPEYVEARNKNGKSGLDLYKAKALEYYPSIINRLLVLPNYAGCETVNGAFKTLISKSLLDGDENDATYQGFIDEALETCNRAVGNIQ